jgi:hypothetical protein
MRASVLAREHGYKLLKTDRKSSGHGVSARGARIDVDAVRASIR